MSKDFFKPADASEEATGKGLRIAIFVLVATVLLFVMSQFASQMVLGVVPAVRHWTPERADNWLANSIGAQFSFVLMADGLLIAGIAWMLRFLRWQWKKIGFVQPRVKHILLGFAAVIPYYALYLILVYALQKVFPALNVYQKQNIGFTSVHGVSALILTFVSLVIIPPIAEEIAMRGFLYTGLRQWLPKVAAAIAVSTVFGAAHLLEGGTAGPLWIGAIDTFTLSLVLVFLREKTGNLWAGITLHALKNGIAFILLFIVAVR